MNLKCPICGCETLFKIQPVEGDTYFYITSVNPNCEFNTPPNGIHVKANGCTTCGFIYLSSPILIGQEIKNGLINIKD